MLLISGALVAVFGGITLALRDPMFIQWKVTVVNWLFAAGFLGSQFVRREDPHRARDGARRRAREGVVALLNTLWIATFAAIGALNLYVMYNFDSRSGLTSRSGA